ncbi:MAG TPA: DUF4062 domain-containing protein [Propionibacteriaceae bacterium]
MSILTPDQRLRVFVSSTLQELAEDRQAVREAIESLRLTPVMFELGARPYPPRALYRAYLEQSDVFIGLYWERYGWVAPGEKVSGLEDEYGLSADRPKLIYIKTPAPNREPRLSELIARIQGDDRASYRRFSDVDELRSLVADDLAVLLTERFSASALRIKPAPSEVLPPLPRPPTRLIGRDGEVRRVLDILADPGNRLVTIVGAGGIGKSRLALAVAERGKDRFTDGVAYVELSAVTEPSLVRPTLAKALGVQEGTGLSLGIQLSGRLADAQMLIVLDNMEQLTETAGDVADLLASADAPKLLVTSRRILDIRGERVFELEPLAVPAAGAAITPAVELFVERARRFRPDYQPSDEDLLAIAELTRRLDGLPLAIELASARLRLLSPRALLERMGHQRLEFLRAGPSDLPARQRTLRDTIAWSYSLLSSESQLLFARLAVFAGSADLEAIEQVTNPDGRLDTLDLLADLVGESLIRATGEAVEPRFGMLETIREFAVALLEASGEGLATAPDTRRITWRSRSAATRRSAPSSKSNGWTALVARRTTFAQSCAAPCDATTLRVRCAWVVRWRVTGICAATTARDAVGWNRLPPCQAQGPTSEQWRGPSVPSSRFSRATLPSWRRVSMTPLASPLSPATNAWWPSHGSCGRSRVVPHPTTSGGRTS